MRASPLLTDFIHARVCKPFCERILDTIHACPHHDIKIVQRSNRQSAAAAFVGLLYGNILRCKLLSAGKFSEKPLRFGGRYSIMESATNRKL